MICVTSHIIFHRYCQDNFIQMEFFTQALIKDPQFCIIPGVVFAELYNLIIHLLNTIFHIVMNRAVVRVDQAN